MLLPRELCDGIISFLFPKEGSGVPGAQGDKKGSVETPFLTMWRLRPALIVAATLVLLGHFTDLETFLSKTTTTRDRSLVGDGVRISGLLLTNNRPEDLGMKQNRVLDRVVL